jgi:hypothetical protein
MLESLVLFTKSLPAWLGHLVEILFVAIVFMTSVTFLSGVWFGMVIIGRRKNQIHEIQFFPPKIVFDEKE